MALHRVPASGLQSVADAVEADHRHGNPSDPSQRQAALRFIHA